MENIRLDPYENIVANLPPNIGEYYYTDNVGYCGYTLNKDVKDFTDEDSIFDKPVFTDEDWLIKIPEDGEMLGKDILYYWVKENHPETL